MVCVCLPPFTSVQNGWTVLLYASIRGHTAIVQVLLRAGADKEARDKVRE